MTKLQKSSLDAILNQLEHVGNELKDLRTKVESNKKWIDGAQAVNDYKLRYGSGTTFFSKPPPANVWAALKILGWVFLAGGMFFNWRAGTQTVDVLDARLHQLRTYITNEVDKVYFDIVGP